MRIDEQNRIVLTVADWMASGLSYVQYENGKKRSQLIATRASNGNPAQIIFSSLRPDFQQTIITNFCGGLHPSEWLLRQSTLDKQNEKFQLQAQLEAKAKQYLNAHEVSSLELKNGIDKGFRIAMTAAWMRLLTTVKGKNDASKLGFESKDELEVEIMNRINTIGAIQVSNQGYFKQRMRQFITQGIASLECKKEGKKNASKVDELQEQVLMTLSSDPRKLSVSQIVVAYWQICEEQGWEKVTYQTVWNRMNTPAFKAACLQKRYGAKAVHDLQRLVINRSKASHPDAMWIMDGTPFELFYTTEDNRLSRLYVFAIIDSFSFKVVGYAIGEGSGEPEALVFQAIKDACIKGNVRPYQLQYDNASSIKTGRMQHLLHQLAKYNTPARPGNARAKKIEPSFGHINETVMKWYKNHSGGNLTAKNLNTAANSDFIKEQFKAGEIPNRDAVIRQIHEVIHIWNSCTGEQLGAKSKRKQSPNELYARPYENKRELTLDMRVSLFWLWRMQGKGKEARMLSYTYTKEGLNIEVKGERKKFLAPASGSAAEMATFLNEHFNDSFQVKYDPDDLGMVALYQNNKFICYAEEKVLIPEALVDFKPQHAGQLARLREIQTLQEEQNNATVAQSIETVDMESIIKGGFYTAERRFKTALNSAEAAYKNGVVHTGDDWSVNEVLSKMEETNFKSLYDDEEEGGAV